MSKRSGFLILLFHLSAILLADSLDPKRLYLQELGEEDEIKLREYIFPYLVTQIGVTSEKSVADLTQKLRTQLKSKALPFKGTYGKKGRPVSKINRKTFPMPKQVIEGDQLDGILDCKAEYCKMKLNTKKEKPRVEKSTKKVQLYHDLVLDRIREYLKKRRVLGYEERADNRKAARDMVKVLNFLGHDYPKCAKFLDGAFWKWGKSSCKPKDSFLRQEMVTLRLDKLQPIWRVSEVFEFSERGRSLFYEFFIYSNHYFDSSARVFEIYDLGKKIKKRAIVVTDIMDIDTLKMSSVARFLYKNEMARTVNANQLAEIKTVR